MDGLIIVRVSPAIRYWSTDKGELETWRSGNAWCAQLGGYGTEGKATEGEAAISVLKRSGARLHGKPPFKLPKV